MLENANGYGLLYALRLEAEGLQEGDDLQNCSGGDVVFDGLAACGLSASNAPDLFRLLCCDLTQF